METYGKTGSTRRAGTVFVRRPKGGQFVWGRYETVPGTAGLHDCQRYVQVLLREFAVATASRANKTFQLYVYVAFTYVFFGGATRAGFRAQLRQNCYEN